MTLIRGRQLSTFSLTPDGEIFSIQVMDEGERPATLELPADCLNALIMTLPDILKQSLCRRFQNESMRLVYPVGAWNVEGSASPGLVIVTLATPDGFQVSFGIPALTLLRMAMVGARACPKASGVMGN